VTGYKKELFCNISNTKKIYNKDWKKTNIVGSLISANNLLSKGNTIVSYSDIYYNQKGINQIKRIRRNFDILLLNNINWKRYWKKRFKNPLDDLETFKTKKHYLFEIGKKTNTFRDIQGQFMGVFAFKKKAWLKIKVIIKKNPSKFKKMDITTFFDYLINNTNLKILTLDYSEYWFEIDNIKDYKILKNSIEK